MPFQNLKDVFVCTILYLFIRKLDLENVYINFKHSSLLDSTITQILIQFRQKSGFTEKLNAKQPLLKGTISQYQP